MSHAAGSRLDWRDGPDEVAPVVLILGGFLTSPPFYRPLRARLLRRGAAGVIVASVWTPDWLLAGAVGLGPIVARAGRAIRAATRLAASLPATRGAPLLVVGHSAGGIVGRLLTAERPFAGRTHAAAPAIGALVTLGSPHRVVSRREIGRRVGTAAAHFANRTVPGATFAPRTGYLAVASRAVVGRPDGDGRARVAYRLYRGLLGDDTTGALEGDGVVPVRSALLDGARQMVLDDVTHGQASGRPWYGTDQGLDQWWPVALEVWHDALRVRAEAATGRGQGVAAESAAESAVEAAV